MQDVIKLVQAVSEDAALIHQLQIEAFMPLYEKYHDDETSPVKESEEKVRKKVEDPHAEYYLICCGEKPIGGIRVSRHRGKVVEENIRWISPLFIIPEYQNKGIAQRVMQEVFDLYPKTYLWKLDTIKQEPGNCHLYEKLGFVRVGEETIVNENMTLVDYEKAVETYMETGSEKTK